jgi:hypothetical protein
MQKESLQLFAKYNLWMNEKLFAAAASLANMTSGKTSSNRRVPYCKFL